MYARIFRLLSIFVKVTERKVMDYKQAYEVLIQFVHDEMIMTKELSEELNMCDRVYRIRQGCNMDTISKALKRLELETGFGVKDGKPKKLESKRKKATKPSEGYSKRTVSQST